MPAEKRLDNKRNEIEAEAKARRFFMIFSFDGA